MTRHTRRARIEELADELTVGAAMRLRCDSAEIHTVVRAVVDYLVQEYPSQDLYIPSGLAVDNYPVAQMRQDLESGRMTVRAICRKYRVSSRTLYQLLDRDDKAAR